MHPGGREPRDGPTYIDTDSDTNGMGGGEHYGNRGVWGKRRGRKTASLRSEKWVVVFHRLSLISHDHAVPLKQGVTNVGSQQTDRQTQSLEED